MVWNYGYGVYCKLQALVYDILPLKEGDGKRCWESGYTADLPSPKKSRLKAGTGSCTAVQLHQRTRVHADKCSASNHSRKRTPLFCLIYCPGVRSTEAV